MEERNDEMNERLVPRTVRTRRLTQPHRADSPDETQHRHYLIYFIRVRPLMTRWPSKLTGDGAEETDRPADQSWQCCRGERRP